jgi:hypothetical protein
LQHTTSNAPLNTAASPVSMSIYSDINYNQTESIIWVDMKITELNYYEPVKITKKSSLAADISAVTLTDPNNPDKK